MEVMEAIEKQKENVLPLKGGRDVLKLSEISQYSERARQEVLKTQQRTYIERIQATADSDDPLEAWVEYISWARQALLNGGQRGDFATILNDCVRKFSNGSSAAAVRESYKFVKVCAEFVDYCNAPLDFLRWMEGKNIGLGFSVFWETKARVLEDTRDFFAADAAYAEGIARNAQPVDRLKKRRKEMQARVANRPKDEEEQAAAAAAQAQQENPGRRAFGAISSSSSSRAPRGGPGQIKSSAKAEQRGPQFSVFPSSDANAFDEPDAEDREWLDFGSQREAIKENTDVAKQWKRVRIPQQKGVAPIATPAVGGVGRPAAAFQVFDDAAENDEPDEVARLVAAAPVQAQPKKEDAKSGKTKISVLDDENDPIFSRMAQPKPAVAPAGKAFAAASLAPSHAAPLPAVVPTKATPVVVARITNESTKEKAAFNEDMLKSETLSFEEVRAMRWMAAEEQRKAAERERRDAEERARREAIRKEEEAVRRAREDLQRVVRETSKPALSSRASVSSVAPTRKQQLQAAARQTLQASFSAADVSRVINPDDTMDTMNYEAYVRGAAKTTNLDALDDLQNVYDDTIDLDRRGGAGKSFFREPTVNTRAVMDEVEKMFNENLSLNDSVAVPEPVKPVQRPPQTTGGATAIASKKQQQQPQQQDFEVYEDDSLESFRLSMTKDHSIANKSHVANNNVASAAPAAPAASHVPFGRSGNNAASSAAAPASKFAVFCDDDDDDDANSNDENVDTVAPVAANNAPAANRSFNRSVGSSFRSFQPMSPISEERQSNSGSGSEELKTNALAVSAVAMAKASSSSSTSATNSVAVAVADPWAVVARIPAAKLSAFPGFVSHGTKKPKIEGGAYLSIGEAIYDMSQQVGGGVDSNVFRSQDVGADGEDEDAVFALKIFKPARPWEPYVNAQIAARCANTADLKRFSRMLAYHQFADQGIMVSTFNENGTLASLLELWKQKSGKGMPEELAAFYAIELLQGVATLHACRIIHTDLTADNVLLGINDDATPSAYFLQLIDFSHAIDLAEFDARASFKSSAFKTLSTSSSSFMLSFGDCDWCFEADFRSVARLVWALLTGEEMRVQKGKSGHWEPIGDRLASHWIEFFSVLLNSPTLTAGQHEKASQYAISAGQALQAFRDSSADQIRKSLSLQLIMQHEKKR